MGPGALSKDVLCLDPCCFFWTQSRQCTLALQNNIGVCICHFHDVCLPAHHLSISCVLHAQVASHTQTNKNGEDIGCQGAANGARLGRVASIADAHAISKTVCVSVFSPTHSSIFHDT